MACGKPAQRALIVLLAATIVGTSCQGDDSADAAESTDADALRDRGRVDTRTRDSAGSDADDPVADSAPSDTPIDEPPADAADDVVAQDIDPDRLDDATVTDPAEEVADEAPDEPIVAPNVRVGFQYVGSDGGSHYVDDVEIQDADFAIVVDEGFEGGELPEGWVRRVQRGFYTWEVHYGPGEAHAGDYSAKVTWYQDQDEWLVSPVLPENGPYRLSFWNKGAVSLAEAATLRVHYTCNDGAEWHELYVFPQAGETESYVWYHNLFEFDCP
jgi:hypothetical protein